MSPTRTTKITRPLPRLIDPATFLKNHDPEFVAAVNRAADLKCLMAIHSGRLRVVQPYKLPEPTRYIPRMDVIDDPSSSNIAAVFEIPGIKSKDITLRIVGRNLVVLGRRQHPYPNATKSDIVLKSEVSPKLEVSSPNIASMDISGPSDDSESRKSPKTLRMLVNELRYGTFERAIPIPSGIKESHIQAAIADGLLTVTWPRSSPTSIGSASPPRSGTTPIPPAPVVTAGTASQ